MTIQWSQETITPELAEKYLANRHPQQRLPLEPRIRVYTRDMMSGNWGLETAEPIKFDSMDRLLDGQNRLSAIVRSGTSQEFSVARNVSEDAFKYLDQGARRTLSQTLRALGFQHYNEVATATRYLVVLSQNPDTMTLSREMSNMEGTQFALEHQERLEWAAKTCKRLHRTMSPGGSAAIAFLGGMSFKAEMEQFIGRIANGFELGPSDPEYRFRLKTDELMRQAKSTRSLKPEATMPYMVTAWNNRIRGKKSRQLAPSENFYIVGAKEPWKAP